MAKVIKQQYGQKTGSGSLDIFHFETDSDMVLIEGRGTTLTQELNTLLQKRTFTLTGDVTGTVEAAGSAKSVMIATLTPVQQSRSAKVVASLLRQLTRALSSLRLLLLSLVTLLALPAGFRRS